MLSFTQYRRSLTEKFLTGGQGSYGYVEIFVNPTLDELDSLSHKDREFEFGAFIAPKHLYVWDRMPSTHKAVSRLIPGWKLDWTPVYLYYSSRSRAVKIAVSSFSMYSRGDYAWNLKDIRATVGAHPAFRIFSKITVTNTANDI